MYKGPLLSTRYSCHILKKLKFSGQIFEKYSNHSNIKFHEDPSSGRRVVAYGRIDMTELIVALGSVAKAPRADTVIVCTMTRLSKLYIPSSYSQGFG
jgi:hypothetical protein